jgi:cyclic beta-1,2-glucan synthetase
MMDDSDLKHIKDMPFNEFISDITEFTRESDPQSENFSIVEDSDVHLENLEKAYGNLSQIARRKKITSSGVEWFLDNYFVIEKAIELIRDDLPEVYFNKLPSIKGEGDLPRVYHIAKSIIVYYEIELVQNDLDEFLSAYQENIPLKMSELWALPLMLRLVHIEILAGTIFELIQEESPSSLTDKFEYPDLSHDEIIARSLRTLLLFDRMDWKDFFEAHSQVEKILREDPLQLYGKMDFETRDQYRKKVEYFAEHSKLEEDQIAHHTVQLALSSQDDTEKARHVGFYLLDDGQQELQKEINYREKFSEKLLTFFLDHNVSFYLGSIFTITALVIIGLLLISRLMITDPWKLLLIGIVILIPASSVAVNLLNSILTTTLPPKILPKMDFRKRVPKKFKSIVAIPALLTSFEELDFLLQQIELHYLSNKDRNIGFVLLTDFGDAPKESIPEDEPYLQAAIEGLSQLNETYRGDDGRRPFYLFHRLRQWNPQEDIWMGWERKRGKLADFNRFLLEGFTDSFDTIIGDLDFMKGVRYVITLDSDTVLPRDSAKALIATMAHPLNHAEFEHGTSKVTRGYTILQPRTEVKPTSVIKTSFTRVFAGDLGLDLYTRAVSDVYQDLFGEGIFVGKGIYDVAAFHRSLENKVPQNSLLSHDLYEGIQGRAGLVTDIVFYEDYPPDYASHVNRLHRWVRGDWQLFPWLFPRVPTGDGNSEPNPFSAIDLWKIIDNLRRSLLAPTTLLSFIFGWLFFHENVWLWTALILLISAFPLLNNIVSSLSSRFLMGEGANVFANVRTAFLRWLLYLIFLPYESFIMIDAVLTTLVRIYLSHKRLLQWTTSAHTIRLFGRHRKISTIWQRMIGAPLISLAIGFLVYLINPISLWVSLPLVVLWVFSPQIAYWISLRRDYDRGEPLTEAEIQSLRNIARQTWLYFERFVGPEDHWLPPDHYQEDPKGAVAHRTSPTNIGLFLLSTAVAYDFGYIGIFDFIYRITYTFETLDKMEKYRGHLFNWYDTRNLETLSPRYVSTVDSGNYAISLMGLNQTLNELPTHTICPSALFSGASDSMGVLSDIVGRIENKTLSEEVQSLYKHCKTIQKDLQQPDLTDTQQVQLLSEVRDHLLQEMGTLIEHISESEEAVPADTIQDLRYWSESIFNHLENTRKQIEILAPWLETWQDRPKFLEEIKNDRLQDALTPWFLEHTLQTVLSDIPELSEQTIKSLKGCLDNEDDASIMGLDDDQKQVFEEWLRKFIQDLRQVKSNVIDLFDQINGLSQSVEFHLERMEFTFLFDKQREVFYLGYQVESGRMDQNHYDLLASEARTASLYAIALNQVPRSHWLHMARPFTLVSGTPTLISWNGSMFEYLMPNLFTSTYPETLLRQTSSGVVQAQIDYGNKHNVPWGISESSYYLFDQADNYQYQGFGVPSLGRKRGLANDLVIAPYASLMAIGVNPRAVLENIQALEKEGALGHFGFFESIDYTKSRLAVGQNKAIIKSYMAHHHGMTLVAFGNYLNEKRVIDRVHHDPRIKTTELLLQEQIPQAEKEQTTKDLLVSVEGDETTGITINPWTPDYEQPGWAVHTLSNGNMNMLMTDLGSGYLATKKVALTRWRQDTALDSHGIWFYVQDLDEGDIWSLGRHPIENYSSNYQVIFSPHMIEIRQEVNETWMSLKTAIMAHEDVCLHKVKITNQSNEKRQYRLLSYGEVVLAPQAMDRQHPAFNKLFIESSYEEELKMLHFQRRLRASTEEPHSMAHLLFDGLPGQVEYTTDRAAFIGRGHDISNPLVIMNQSELGREVGTTLDPIFSIGKRITLNPNQSATLTYVTIAAEDKNETISVAESLQNEFKIENAFSSAESHNEKLLRALDLSSDQLCNYQQLLSHVLSPIPQLRAEPALMAKNELGQSGLWPYGISGDYPILLVLIHVKDEIDALQDVLLAHNYWRKMGMMIDLVILNTKDAGYAQDLNNRINRVINILDSQVILNQRGGIFTLTASQIDTKALHLLKTASNVLLDLKTGDLENCLQQAKAVDPHLPTFIPTSPQQEFVVEEKITKTSELFHDNGIGGFTPDGREYHIFLDNYPKSIGQTGQITPLPWVNVIANQDFGFLITESGGGYTWSINSGENRLTPWTNDPISDPIGECLYLRDEINGKIWSPTPAPAGDGTNYLVRHGQGYTVFESIHHGFRQSLRMFTDAECPVKIIELTMTNLTQQHRRITATYFAEWVLGANRESSMKFIVPTFEHESGSLMARNTYSAEFSERVAFLTTDHPVHGLTTDRQEFLGVPGNRRNPAALKRVGLSGQVNAGVDPCAALQVHLNFSPGEEHKVTFVLGQGADEDEARKLAKTFSKPEMGEDRFAQMSEKWDRILCTLQVETPAQEMNLILNRWLLYQTLSSRIWGRSGFFQSSGAYGFRDQLQDVASTIVVNPEISREHILRAARHQFDAGDVLHWWHPPSGRGVRTRITDDLLWLVYITAEYVKATGDTSILHENVPFRVGEPLKEDEEERYGHYETSQETFSIFEHCRRALERGDTQGPHGLPLIGGGDWNDGMNRVGIGGKGESVWLGWFLIENHKRFADLCEIVDDKSLAEQHRQRARELADVINEVAWDGNWYLRAYYDNGNPLGSRKNMECKIDSLPQSWSILTEGAPEARQNQAIQALEQHLVQKKDQIIQLFTPPFNNTKQDPGYIKGYPPGIRENGGQYTHAAIWAVWALTELGLGDKAFEQFTYLNPITHSSNLTEANQYRVEPYVVAADIYSTPPHTRRGGWTWYTGSSGWLYRLGMEAISGFHLLGDRFTIKPCIPAEWDSYKLIYKNENGVYNIEVKNPDHVQSGVRKVFLDGIEQDDGVIPLNDEQADHHVEIIMGQD